MNAFNPKYNKTVIPMGTLTIARLIAMLAYAGIVDMDHPAVRAASYGEVTVDHARSAWNEPDADLIIVLNQQSGRLVSFAIHGLTRVDEGTSVLWRIDGGSTSVPSTHESGWSWVLSRIDAECPGSDQVQDVLNHVLELVKNVMI